MQANIILIAIIGAVVLSLTGFFLGLAVGKRRARRRQQDRRRRRGKGIWIAVAVIVALLIAGIVAYLTLKSESEQVPQTMPTPKVEKSQPHKAYPKAMKRSSKEEKKGEKKEDYKDKDKK